MSEIKSLSVGNGDMFYINHNSDNFSMIDCNIADDRKSEILDEVKNLAGKKDIVRFISTHPDQDHIQGIEYLDELGLIPNFYGSVRPGLTFRPVIFLRLHNGRPLSNLNPARGDAPETGRVARLALPFHADLPANSPSPRRAPAS